MADDVSKIIVEASFLDLASGGIGMLLGNVEHLGGGLGLIGSAAGFALGGVVALGTAGAAALGFAADSAIGLQGTISQLQVNTGASAEAMEAFRKTAQGLQSDIGANMDQMATGFMHAHDVTQDTAQSLAELTIGTKAATASNADAGVYVNLLSTTMREYNLDINKVTGAHLDFNDTLTASNHVMGMLVVGARDANATLPQFEEYLSRVASQAAAMNVPLQDVEASIGALTRHGFSSDIASTQVRGILTQLDRSPTKARASELEAMDKELGLGKQLEQDVTSEGLAREGLTGVLKELNDAYDRLYFAKGRDHMSSDEIAQANAKVTESAGKLVTAQRGGIGLSVLLTNASSDYSSILGDLNNNQKDNAAVTDILSIQQATFSGRLKDARGEILTMAQTIGSSMIPMLMNWMGKIDDLLKKVSGALPGAMAQLTGNGTAGPSDFLGGILSKVEEFLPVLMDKMEQAGKVLFSWVEPAIPPLINAVGNLTLQVLGVVIDFLPTLANALLRWGAVFGDWILTSAVPFISANLPRVLNVVADFLTSAVIEVASFALPLATAITGWITQDALPTLTRELPTLTAVVVNFIDGMLPVITGAVVKLGAALAGWITTDAVPRLVASLPFWQRTITDAISTLLPIVTTDLLAVGTRMATWVTTSAVPMLVAALPAWERAITTFISGALPVISHSIIAIASTFTTWLTQSAVPMLVAALPGWLHTLLDFIDKALPIVAVTVISLAKSLSGWIVSDAIPQLMQHLPSWLNTLGGFITQALPVVIGLVEHLGMAMGEFITKDAIPFLQKYLPSWIGTIAEFIGTSVKGIAGFIAPLAKEFYGWITTTAIPYVKKELPGWLEAMKSWITGTAAPDVKKVVGGAFSVFGTWIHDDAIPYLKKNLPVWLEELKTWLTGTAGPDTAKAVGGVSSAFGTWIHDDAIPYLKKNLPVWLAELKTWVTGTAIPDIEGVLKPFGDWIIKDAIPYLKKNLPIWLGEITKWIKETALPDITKALHTLVDSIDKDLTPAFDAFGGAVKNAFSFVTAATGFLHDHEWAQKAVIAGLEDLGAAILVYKTAQAGISAWNFLMKLSEGLTKAWTAAQWLFNIAMDANPIGLIVIGVAALVVGFIELYKHSDKVREIVADVWQVMKDLASMMKLSLTEACQWIGQKFDDLGTGIHDWLAPGGKIGQWFDHFGTIIQTVFWQKTKDFVQPVIDFFDNLGNTVHDWLGSGGKVGQFFTDFGLGLQVIWQNTKNFIQPIIDFFTNLKNGINDVLGPLGNFIGKITGAPQAVVSWIGGKIPHAEGINTPDSGWINEPVTGIGLVSKSIYTFGERGPERIRNEEQEASLGASGMNAGDGYRVPSSGMGGGTTIFYNEGDTNINVGGSVISEAQLGQIAYRELLKLKNRGNPVLGLS